MLLIPTPFRRRPVPRPTSGRQNNFRSHCLRCQLAGTDSASKKNITENPSKRSFGFSTFLLTFWLPGVTVEHFLLDPHCSRKWIPTKYSDARISPPLPPLYLDDEFRKSNSEGFNALYRRKRPKIRNVDFNDFNRKKTRRHTR